jgi:hypothetical protein
MRNPTINRVTLQAWQDLRNKLEKEALLATPGTVQHDVLWHDIFQLDDCIAQARMGNWIVEVNNLYENKGA